MSKQEELALLRILIKDLGPDSYIGPWLQEQLPFIEADMRSDLTPMVSYFECKAHCAALVERATAESLRIVERVASHKKQLRETCNNILESL